MKKLIISLVLIFLLTFIIYKVNDKNLIDYMAIGDSINLGINSYGNYAYGYNDYLRAYLENNNMLHKYNAYYSKDNYTIAELINDIENNKEILYDDKTYNIKRELREADLVSLAIGMDELVQILIDNKDTETLQGNLDVMVSNMEKLLKSITSLSKSRIVLLGYYMPYQSNKDKEKAITYLNDKYKQLANKYSIMYVDIYNVIKEDKMCLPNEKDYHLTSHDYLKIANEIIKKIE